ncbi:MAG: hypothetical protein A2X13_04995 [Bacteroidetes bacterium GWC2_33_15]|nr:MAG: hypothetical protein A2X10_12865 [Bacteroidetes bacterium GWA2_33_15]OFX50949.1 MAG: hypothetical protein A2X13_04995 [Bacteroidetes bacterium GWC2_33_15]OFX66545.1 MAG: hypothetical protein A2X15_15365 [Bacteroidetes bacterium GWB2_32_14]OFX70175.1 MAG: hypothetical protein A2X14_12755 [Bacteroidetes bacterium GWD2_33_33]HAN20012.1 hypothetical protein [Bacteroidales bacterium]
MKIYPIVLLVVLTLLFSCSSNNENKNDKVLAKVHEKYLYSSELKDFFPANIKKEDSIQVARNYINNWIKKQLLLRKAEMNLSDENRDIEKQIEDYRSSLLIFRYQQELINQKLDTNVTESEIEKYYNEFSGNFILNQSIIKAVYVKVSSQAPDIANLRQWCKSDDIDDMGKLDEYCYQYATKYNNFNNQWIPFNNLFNEIPINVSDEERLLTNQRFIEVKDSVFYYFVKINDYKLRSTIQPLDYASLKIKGIILNKRKFTFIEELENNIYNDASDRDEFIIY